MFAGKENLETYKKIRMSYGYDEKTEPKIRLYQDAKKYALKTGDFQIVRGLLSLASQPGSFPSISRETVTAWARCLKIKQSGLSLDEYFDQITRGEGSHVDDYKYTEETCFKPVF